MRLIYMDEAGTSAKEPVRIVASIIVEANTHWKALARGLERAIDECVPEQFKQGFWFHATDVYGGGKYREDWQLGDRLEFLKRVASLPRSLEVPIAVGKVFRQDGDAQELVSYKVRRFEMEHLMAFSLCAERSDHYVRHYTPETEISAMIAEDLPHMRKILAAVGLVLRETPMEVGPEHQLPSHVHRMRGRAPEGYLAKITRVIDTTHFVAKGGAPLLQIADACAFIFRRCLAGHTHGQELLLAMLGEKHGSRVLTDPPWFSGAMSADVFHRYS